MQLRVISPESNKKLNELKIGDLILCEDLKYYPVKSILLTAGVCRFFRLSNNVSFHLSERAKIKTEKGFKIPELYDTIVLIGSEITPQITVVEKSKYVLFCHDILVEGNIVSPEGIVFRYSD